MGKMFTAFFAMFARMFNTVDLALKSTENLAIAGEAMSASVADEQLFKRKIAQHEMEQKVLAFAKTVNQTIDASAS